MNNTVIIHVPGIGYQGNADQRAVTPAGRAYSGVPGTPVEMSAEDAAALTGWGWMLAASGNSVGEGITGNRPQQPAANDRYLDYDVGHEIFFDGVKWRDPLTGNLV